MKIITLLPAKNEAWIIANTLKNISEFSDHIILSDQHSEDGSYDIYKRYPKLTVIRNSNIGHNNSVRWELLDKARELFGVGNLIVCIDADETISKEAIEKIRRIVDVAKDKSLSFSFPWIQLWGSVQKYRTDGVWKKNNKTIAFFDDGIVNYERQVIINDHTARTPLCKSNIHIDQYPLLHYQYINLKRSEIKRVWYQCSELILGLDPRKINHKYSPSKESKEMILKDVPIEWATPHTLKISYDVDTDWRYKEILTWFTTYGINFFEPLDIWNIPEFKQKFTAKMQRGPRVKKFPGWLTFLNYIKNTIVNKIK